jgi:hypothetical protein
MSDIQQLLERQARWQKARRTLSWPEKIRMAERIRESVRKLRRSQKAEPHRRPFGESTTKSPQN